MASPSLAPAKVHYPSSDRPADGGKRLPTHPADGGTYAVDRLRHHFRGRRDVYVSGNLLLYYQKGNPRAAVAPDVFVVLGVSNVDRSSYRLWEFEPKGPDFVLEITSRGHDVPRRPGTQARVVPFAGRAGVLAIRPDARLSGAAAAGPGAERGGVSAAAGNLLLYYQKGNPRAAVAPDVFGC